MKKLIYLFLIIFASANASFSATFKDIPEGYWAYNAIDRVTDEKIISGYPDGKFRPDKMVTRAEYSAMVLNAIGQENSSIETVYDFEDIDSKHWAWNYVLRAINLDILKPVDKYHFCPDEYVTRSEIINFLANILKTEHITKKEAVNALQSNYIDFSDIPDWFIVPAGKVEVLGLIAKQPPRVKYLDYDKNLTRAQMAVFLANLRQELDLYTQQAIEKSTTPKVVEGIKIDNVICEDDIATVLKQTVLPIVISKQIDSKDSVEGQMFQARFVDNIVDYDNHLLFSKDTILIGKLLETTRSKNFVRNGEFIIEFSSVNNNNLLTKIMAVAECEEPKMYSGFKKFRKSIIKGRELKVKAGDIVYIKLYKPVRINIVTGEILD